MNLAARAWMMKNEPSCWPATVLMRMPQRKMNLLHTSSSNGPGPNALCRTFTWGPALLPDPPLHLRLMGLNYCRTGWRRSEGLPLPKNTTSLVANKSPGYEQFTQVHTIKESRLAAVLLAYLTSNPLKQFKCNSFVVETEFIPRHHVCTEWYQMSWIIRILLKPL